MDSMLQQDRWSERLFVVLGIWLCNSYNYFIVRCEEPQASDHIGFLYAIFLTAFLTAGTMLLLSNQKRTIHYSSCNPHNAQLRAMSISSLAMIEIHNHRGGHCHWIQCLAKVTSPPLDPDTSVCMVQSGNVVGTMQSKLILLQLCRNIYYHARSE